MNEKCRYCGKVWLDSVRYNDYNKKKHEESCAKKKVVGSPSIDKFLGN